MLSTLEQKHHVLFKTECTKINNNLMGPNILLLNREMTNVNFKTTYFFIHIYFIIYIYLHLCLLGLSSHKIV